MGCGVGYEEGVGIDELVLGLKPLPPLLAPPNKLVGVVVPHPEIAGAVAFQPPPPSGVPQPPVPIC